MVSLPLPPMAVSMTVPKAMPMLLVLPPALEKVPGARLITASCVKPERSSLLCVPLSQMVMTGLVLIEKS